MPTRSAHRAEIERGMRKETERSATIAATGSHRSSISLEDIDFSTSKHSRRTSMEQVGASPVASALTVVSSNTKAKATLNRAKSPGPLEQSRPQYEEDLMLKLKRVSLRVRVRHQYPARKPTPASVQVPQVKFCLLQPTRPKGVTKSSGGMMPKHGKAGIESLSKIVNLAAERGLGVIEICELLDDLVNYGSLGPRISQALRQDPKPACVCPPDCFDCTDLLKTGEVSW
ncbi:hypothetical protein EWM64_g8717 [Hericium alpestre]|uniref:Uncharacterized protein n=1 Tax=Hericium alpestre TaxID=135208 RepID=A0A4Y9ZKZ9_9AGAM|nr:hypothetical protein EWM64_g8717 [Hericium alpestre]